MMTRSVFIRSTLFSLLVLQGCSHTLPPTDEAPSFFVTTQSSAGVKQETVPTPIDLNDRSTKRRPPSHWGQSSNPKRMARPQPSLEQENDRTTLNFVEVEIDQVVRSLASFTGRNFIVDPRVAGKITLVSETPVTASQAYSMLLSALRMQGFAITTVDNISRVIPEADAKLHSTPVSYSPEELLSLKGEIVTQVFRLQHEKANDLLPVLRPMVSPANPINAYAANNSLVITDYADNLLRIADVIQRIDTHHSVNTEVISIEYGVAIDVAALATQLLNGTSNDPFEQVQIVADPRSNSVILRAGSPARLEMAKDLIYKIDNPNAEKSNLHVVYLKNAQATHLAQVLRGALEGLNPQSTATNATNNSTTTPTTPAPLSTNPVGMSDNSETNPLSQALSQTQPLQPISFSAAGATIQADPTTNTLIISAPAPLYRGIREVIDQLDQRRAQVLVESLIVEVNAEDANEFGIQWMLGGSHLQSGGSGVVGGSNFGGSGVGTSMSGATTIDALAQGLSLGLVKGTVNILGNEIVNLGVLARALERNSGSNVLSTPNLLTLDNEEASITVGRTVPFVTGQYTTSGDGASNPFQTIEREDVGLTLRIRPQISEGGTVKLALYQEVSSIDPSLSISSTSLVTRKRALETNVLVDDGQIIVLGGLLEDNINDTTSSVPFLGDIPVIGNLFRHDSRQRTKTNLMIFLRPHIIRNSEESAYFTLDRYNYMRATQQNMPNHPNWFAPTHVPAVLPPLERGSATPVVDLREEE